VKQVWTYAQLLSEVETAAGLLRDLGVKKGDGVMIYFPAGASRCGHAKPRSQFVQFRATCPCERKSGAWATVLQWLRASECISRERLLPRC
jgi:acyl-CoA synthetase (AMP-forming)/AMP-acid ligase II